MRLIKYVPVFLLALAACSRQAPELTSEVIALNNRGVALMGHYDYVGALEAFTAVVEAQPNWLDAQTNLAIATLNRQQEGDEQLALDIAGTVLAKDSGNLRAHYVSGLLRLYLGETETARSHFQAVVEGDPEDAHAAYYVGQCQLQLGNLEEAAKGYERALKIDPYLRSAYYGAALVLRRLNRGDEARAMLEQYERFKDNPRAQLVEFKYTRMGPKAEALAANGRPQSLPTAPEGAVFETGETLASLTAGDNRSVTTADIDGDGRQDLYLASGDETKATVFIAGTDGTYREDESHTLAGVNYVNAALWGDYDNDGLVDVYLCRKGDNQLWRQSGSGQWQDVTQSTETADAGKTCVDGAVFDADHDGDLDYFLTNSDGPNELLNNNRDGTFRTLAESQGLIGYPTPGRQVVIADIDNDRDADILVIREQPPHEIYINDRLWQYRLAENFADLSGSEIVAALVGDVDADGRVELYAANRDGWITVWQYDAGTFKSVHSIAGPGPVTSLALEDFNGDGQVDLLRVREKGFEVLSFKDGYETEEIYVYSGPLAEVVPVLEGDAAGPSLVGISIEDTEHHIRRWAPGPGRHDYAVFVLTGMDDKAQSMRSNYSGIGTRLVLRNGSRWSIVDTFDRHSGRGQSLQPLALGLGGRDKADYVALYWSDGVFQTELDVEAGSIHNISETQRQLSSCPVLFAWNGSGFGFVSDILGVGGLGFFNSPGQYNEPRPWEYFLLDDRQLTARDGRYMLKITEPMEENAYLDRVALRVLDVPPGWSMALDERMATGAPEVTGEPIFYRREIALLAAVNQDDKVVTESLQEADAQAAPVGPLDKRFIGRLAQPHVLTLEFEQPLETDEGKLVLLADGWIEYPYSQTVFAAWQAQEDYRPASLEAEDASGQWVEVYEAFGYPAGMPRQMALPLAGLPVGTRRLRLSSNMEIYWDRIRVVVAEESSNVRRHKAPMAAARLAKTGFPRRVNYAQRRPYYIYSDRSPYWDTKYLTGYYTTFGPIMELVAETDDALAIVGPGEEAHVEFEAIGTPPAQGWKRYFVLEARGYAKDMDLYTRDGETVGPLPVRQPADKTRMARREALHKKYNTRFQAGD